MENDKKLIIDGAEGANIWRYLEDETPITNDPVIISLNRLQTEGAALAAAGTPFGVILRAGEKQGEDVHALAPFIDKLAVIAIEFPVYRNGRGYSAARILREQMNYRGEIRAIGEVLFDQWQFMHRCGINAFEINADISLETFNEALGELSAAYQPAADAQRGILWRRHN
ncbi:MAG: hypothetical protein CBD03_06190 [Rhizobiales bacterium TMED143]|nr:oxidoreductase [Rhodobiaceae bacterium]OUV89783.1 MAG: hypothetical protein CBD03_06190 [Rhizobiales bacterium TMED143]CAI8309552.1 MAG: Uncharacterised protein [Rhodobiaceae bacterium UBA7378]HCQ81798.1 oxidoreductase [Rhodobiaceae bacterium]|tara:strand:- start:376 stop:885 length:510 start_codon:yes stop_codon:yes gene_type:complete